MDELVKQLDKLAASLDNQVRNGDYSPALVEKRDTMYRAAEIVRELGSVKS